MKRTKKLATKLHKGTQRKKICVICVICGFYFSYVSGGGRGIMRNYHGRNK